jgi:hypothetical protein
MAAAAMAPIRTVSLTVEEQQELAGSSRILMRLMNRMGSRTSLDSQTMISVARFIACADVIYELDSRRRKK